MCRKQQPTTTASDHGPSFLSLSPCPTFLDHLTFIFTVHVEMWRERERFLERKTQKEAWKVSFDLIWYFDIPLLPVFVK